MADPVLSLAAQTIRTIINEQSNGLISNMRSEAEALCTELQNFFVDTQGNTLELTNNMEVHTWLSEVRRIACDAGDVVDDFVFQTESMALSSLRRLTRACRATKKLGTIKERVKKLKSQLLDDYSKGLLRIPRPAQVRQELALQQVHLHTNDNFVVGIDADVERLVKMLVGKSQNESIDVLTIVGMGGSGKSIVARNIYNHRDVRWHFSYKAWIPLTCDFSDEFQLLSELLKQMTSHWNGSARNLIRLASQSTDPDQCRCSGEQMKSYLQNLLKMQKCLVVFDDVWDWTSINDIIHELIQPSNSNRVCKSKIVITSRQRLLRPNTYLKRTCYETKSLSEEDSWKLFDKVSSSAKAKRRLARDYQGFSNHMLKKCKGLPLAIVALGRLLKDEDNIQEWERMFNQLKSEGPHLSGLVNNVLALSYYELPQYLKPCFLYLGLFAPDDIISARALMRMWIAEGFVKCQQNNNETPEKVAEAFLEELVNHTMVQVVTKTSTEKVIELRINDLMRDICVMIAEKQEFLTLLPSDSDQGLGETHSRHVGINQSKFSTLPCNKSKLRSLRIHGKSNVDTGVADKQYGIIVNQQRTLDLSLVCQKFKLLRVLDINGIKTSDGTMPKKIGGLLHLRYLGITSTNIQELPNSIGKLRMLITLDYRDVSVYKNEIRLPNVFWKLEQLRHLFLPNEMVSNTRGYLKLDTLKNLQTLWGVKGGDWMLREMKNLSLSITKLYIQGIFSLEQLKAVFAIHNHIDVLALDWHGFEWDSLHELHTKSHLRKLRLTGRAPDFNRPQMFPSDLQKLELYYTHLKRQETMDDIGRLPSLKFLVLASESFMGEKWNCSTNNRFPELEELELSNLPNLEDWQIEKGAMPCLKRLSIASCTNLKKLSDGLECISTLETLRIAQMPTEFNRRFRKLKGWWNSTKVGGEDFHIVQHIPNIEVTDSRILLSL